MKNVRTLLEIVEQWVTQIEDIMIGSNKTQYNQQNQEPEFSVDLPRNRISNSERELIEKNVIIDFRLKERSKPVSYKKENQNIITDANKENEEGTKPRKSREKKAEPTTATTTKKKHSVRWWFYADRDIRKGF